MSKKRLIITSVISIVLVAVLMMGSTYSIFTTTEVDENTNVYKTGNLDVTYTLSSSNVQIIDSNPMTVEEADAVVPYRITVTNNGNVPYMFDVILDNTTASDAIDSKYIMTKVGYLEPKKLSNCTNNVIKEDIILPAGESVDIDVRVWLGANLSNSEIGKSFYAKLSIDGQAVYDNSTDIDNSILSLNYMKDLFPYEMEDFVNLGTFEFTGRIVRDYFKSKTYNDYIVSASFVDYIDTNNSIEFWDVSEKGDNSVVAWVENNETEGYYDLYIGSKYKIYAENLGFFFSNLDVSSETFGAMISLNTINFNNLDTSLTKNMSSMFSLCSGLTSLDVSNFDTSNVTNMSFMFLCCGSITSLDVSSFDTSKVIDMSFMFSGLKFQSIEISMQLISLDVSNFDTSSVTTMSSMFSSCSGLTSLDVSEFDTSNVTDMSFMFDQCRDLTSLDVSNFDTSKVINMRGMFQDCKSLTNLDVSNFDTSSVTDMIAMFNLCEDLTSLDVSNFDTSKVIDMGIMFQDCKSLTNLDVSNFDTSKVINMHGMFQNCKSLTNLDVSGFDTSNVTDMSNMFSRCSGLTSLDVSGFDTSNVTGMSHMFFGCSGLISLDVSGFDTSNVTDMSYMFYICSGLTTTITIRNANTQFNEVMFYRAATETGAQITVNYTSATSTLVDNMIATKSDNSNVVKGSQVS